MVKQNTLVEPQEQVQKRKSQKQIGITDLATEMKDWFIAFERSVAGYNSLHLSLLSFNGQIPEGERKKGLPIFTHPASVDGVNTIEVVTDLKFVDPQYVQHVLVPMINAHANVMMEALEEIGIRVDTLQKLLNKLLTPPSEEENS